MLQPSTQLQVFPSPGLYQEAIRFPINGLMGTSTLSMWNLFSDPTSQSDVCSMYDSSESHAIYDYQ